MVKKKTKSIKRTFCSILTGKKIKSIYGTNSQQYKSWKNKCK